MPRTHSVRKSGLTFEGGFQSTKDKLGVQQGWPHIAALCSGEGQEILVDVGAHGEVRSKTGKITLFQQRDDGFDSL